MGWRKKIQKIIGLGAIMAICFQCFSGTSIAASAAGSIELWVDPINGNDSNNGGIETPYRTIDGVKSAAAELSESDDVTVWLKGGTYTVNDTILFGETEAGKNGHTITYKAVADEQPVISGGVQVDGWTLYDRGNNIYVASISEDLNNSRQFYVNGERQIRSMSEVSPTDWTLLDSAGYVSPGVGSPNANEYMIMDLGEVKEVSSVILYPNDELDSEGLAAGFPKDFTIEISTDGNSFEVVHSVTDQVAPSVGSQVEVVFEAVSARYVKLNVTELGSPERLDSSNYMLSLSEIKIGTVGSVIDDSHLDFTVAQHVDLSQKANVSVTQVGYCDIRNETLPFTPSISGSTSALIDNNYGNFGGTHNIGQYISVFKPVIDLSVADNDSAISIAAIELSVRTNNGTPICYPEDFEIQIPSGDSWTTVLKIEDCDWGSETTKIFTFNPIVTKQIRLFVNNFGNDENGKCTYCQLTEIAVYKPADLAKGASVTATNSWEYAEAGLSKNVITSGIFNSGYYTSYPASTPTSLSAPVTVDLGESRSVGGIRLYPRGGNWHYVKAMQVEVSEDDVNYTTVLNVQNVVSPEGACQFFVFSEAINTRYVRIVPTEIQNGENGQYRFQLRALEVAPASQEGKDNPIPEDIISQAGSSSSRVSYDIKSITVLNDNSDHKNKANKAIDGFVYSDKTSVGFVVPESYNLQTFANIEDLEVHIRYWWYHKIYKVSGASEDGTEIYYTEPKGALRPAWIENAYALIDQAGEWYIDKTANKIYYKAEIGVDAAAMNANNAVLPAVDKLLVFDGCSNVTFEGVNFEYTTWTFPTTDGYDDAQSGTYHNNPERWGEVPGGVEIGASSNIKISKCEVYNFGAGGIRIWNDSQSNEISNCVIRDISSGGIWVGSMHGHTGSTCEGAVKDNTIYNNYITRVGVDIHDASAITVLYTENTVIDHNEICNTPYTGISLGWGWASNVADCTKNNVISNNYIHNTGLVVHDGGSIYTLGSQPGTKIYGNYMHTHSDGLNSKDAGIYLDEGSSNIEVYGNVVGDGVYWWSNMWTSTITNNYWHDNYYSVNNTRDNGVNNVYENNTYVEGGDFSQIATAQEIINDAGLAEEGIKENVIEGIASKHNINLTMYDDVECYYFAAGNGGVVSFSIPNQIGNTQYNLITRQIEILMPEGTDVTALVPMIELENGYSSDKDSGTVQDFTNPVTYTITKDGEQFVWVVKVKVDVTTSGEPVGTEVTLDSAIDSENWTVVPGSNSDGSIMFNQGASYFSGYIGERYSEDTILKFDMSSNLNTESKDWMGYSLRSQDPYVMLGTMYHVCINNGSIELQKWINGQRTMLFGTIDGFTPVYGDLTNDFFTANERHSIKTGAIDVPSGVRIFLYVDGNKVFDIIDTDNPISNDGYFVVYPMTQAVTLMDFSDIQKVSDAGKLEDGISIKNIGEATSGVTVTEPIDGWVEGRNTFTVSGSNACIVAVKDANGTYSRVVATAEETDGVYSFTVEDITADTELVVAVAGDVNGDGQVNASDVTMARAASLGNVTLDNLSAMLVDANGDGNINAADATLLRAVSLGSYKFAW